MLLQLQNISFTFPGKNHLLNDVSVSLEEKKIYALLGPNGSGKTTLFNLLTGFLKTQNGKAIFRNKTINNLSPFETNRLGIGRTFQDLRIITKLTVKENIILAMQDNPSDHWYNALLLSVNKDVKNVLGEKAEKILQQFFLDNVKEQLASEISYGQQKLLTLACCVANGAELLLLDEPVAGIQPEYRNKIAQLLMQLKMDGKTILLIEHNTDVIEKIAEEIFFMNNGEITNFKSIEELRANALVMEAYL